MIDDLLEMADALADYGEAGRTRQAYLRRSLSTAYYALFHSLAKMCADELVGVKQVGTEPWVRVYRALAHRAAKDALNQNIVQRLHPAAKAFADAFIELQEKRNTADYDPKSFPFGRRATKGYIQQARTAIASLAQLDSEHKRLIAAVVLFKSRP
jgi:uncharacterized protein (UPF0332 family)